MAELPLSSENQPYCVVSALEAGLIELADELFISNAKPGAVTLAPSLSFLIQHSTNRQKFVFDLGIRRDWQNYPPTTTEWIKSTYPVSVPQDVVESLAKGGVSPDDITTIGLSHCHWDHVGDTHSFPKSTFVVGSACKSLFNPGYPADPKGRFSSELLPIDRTNFLSVEGWEPVGPFPHALDFYGDGSLYIVDAPGHLSGHINVLARTSPDGGWIYLAGDSAHHWDIVTGKADVATGTPHAHGCAHEDRAAAKKHLERIQALWKIPRVRIILAHDEPWYRVHKGSSAFWPGKLDSL